MRQQYEAWRRLVFAKRWTWPQLRCDERPTDEMLAEMDRIGLPTWERFVKRLQREADSNLIRMAFGKD